MDPDNAEALLAGIVPKLSCTVVVDAVGMAYLTAHPEGLGHLEGRAVLTPNQTELAITLGMDEDEVGDDPVGAIVRLATTAGATVVSGSATSWVASPEGAGLGRGHRRPGAGRLRVRRRQVGHHHRSLRPGLPAGAGRRLGHLPARSGR